MSNAILTTIVGVPIDCAGTFSGVERMPVTLREAGLIERLQINDFGDLTVTIDTAERDVTTGIIGFQQVCQASETIRDEMKRLLARGERPLLLGGCCTLLIGVMAALRQHYGSVGLAFIDGHLDFYDGASSPTGEAADMELAILTGLGPTGLIDLDGSPPLVNPSDIVVMGFRDAEAAQVDGAPDPAVIRPGMTLHDVKAVRGWGGRHLGNQAAQQFETASKKFWLHLDLDVLDQSVMPAVDYQMPNGLMWEDVQQLLRPLLHSPNLIGMDVTIYNPTLDPDNIYAKHIVNFLADILTMKTD